MLVKTSIFLLYTRTFYKKASTQTRYCRLNLFAVIILSLILFNNSFANTSQDAYIPTELKQWIPWVLKDNPSASCPILYNQNQNFCAYPDILALQLDEKTGRFQQHWQVYATSWVPLPGDDKYWPENVQINAQLHPVVSRQGKPFIQLELGEYDLTGEFNWSQQPESITIPYETGMLDLTLNDDAIAFPDFRKGKLWLKTQQAKSHQNNRLELQVFRKITDSIPLKVSTEIKLSVSGQQREMILDGTLLKDFIASEIKTRLPSIMDKQGRLKVQIRPGQWTINVTGFYPGQLISVALPAFKKPLPVNEIWVLDQQPHLRRINVIDKISIDANQTQLPKKWQTFPAFQMQGNEVMRFNVVKRGNPEPEPDQLNLRKKIWLDFDGLGFTINDKITGKLSRQWRLNASKNMKLGQVTLNGKPQYITEDENQQQGVEVRHGALNLSADSQMNAVNREFPASGWNMDFNSVDATLYLPAGWKLFSLSGANADSTWIRQWTLLDLFIVLITAIAGYKLWGLKWGMIGLLAFMLTWHQSGAPQFIWLNLIVAIALFRALPEGRFASLVKSYRFVSTIVLVLIVLPFVVDQARLALYPQLEFYNSAIDTTYSPVSGAIFAEQAEEADMVMAKSRPRKNYGVLSYSDRVPMSVKPKMKEVSRVDPNAMIQTGPGLPIWTLNQYAINWDGPVRKDQVIKMTLIPPMMNAFLNVLRIIFVLLMVWRILDIAFYTPLIKSMQAKGDGNALVSKSSTASASILIVIVTGMLCLTPTLSNAASYAVFPDKILLEELKNDQLKPTQCLPHCASIESISIALSEQELTMSLRVHAQENISIPLPVPLKHWMPETLQVDDSASASFFRHKDANLWLHILKGTHTVKITGRVDYLTQLQIAFPLKPHHIYLNVTGWSSEGMDQDVRKITALSFLRLSKDSASSVTRTEIQSEIPVYTELSRTFELGLEWQIINRIKGLSGTAYPVILRIPLISGESVITENVKVMDNHVVVTLSHRNQTLQWRSSLSKKLAFSSNNKNSDKGSIGQIKLKAIDSNQIIERWRLNASTIWHIEHKGIPVIYHQREGKRWQPQWQPWPGEEVVIMISRPHGVKGNTITIDSSNLTLGPGEQITSAKLDFNLRSSLGGQHIIHLPEQAELKTVKINNRNMPIRNTSEGLSLPVLPGNQKISIEWHEVRGISEFFASSLVSLGSDSVNHSVKINPGYNRWVLFVSGPAMGPAVLFWGVFGIILLISYALGRIRGTPLKTWHWILLWIGLSASAPWAVVVIAGCILALKVRNEQDSATMSALKFNVFQIVLVLLILLSLAALTASIQQGLLGTPDMQITGNGSSAYQLNWFSDRMNEVLPQATLISVPVYIYRLMMLIWSIWLAFALIKWAQWGWSALTREEYWRHVPRRKVKKDVKKNAHKKSGQQNKNDLSLDENEIQIK